MSYQHTVVKLKDDHYTGQFLVEKVLTHTLYIYIQIKKIKLGVTG